MSGVEILMLGCVMSSLVVLCARAPGRMGMTRVRVVSILKEGVIGICSEGIATPSGVSRRARATHVIVPE